MKKSLLVISFVMLLAQFNLANAQMKQYYYKTGCIKYQFSGNVEGEATFYWDDYGCKKSEVSKGIAKIMGMTKDYNRTRISVDEEQYTIETNKKMELDEHKPFVFWQDHQNITDPHKFNIALMKEIEMKNANRNETISGYKCSVWEKKGVTMWVHQGMLMKMLISKMGFKFEMTATEFIKNAKVPQGTFDISK